MSKALLKSTGIVSAMTSLSRVTGFIRDMVYAQMFGAGAGTDAFFVAFRIPNFLRRLFAEGRVFTSLRPGLFGIPDPALAGPGTEGIGRSSRRGRWARFCC
jgi:putative peptidoglycan lipid II flippase